MGIIERLNGSAPENEGAFAPDFDRLRRRPTVRLAVLCALGTIGAQTWMPLIGFLSDMYRSGAFSLENLSSLLLPYLLSLAAVAIAFPFLRSKSAPSRGTYGVLAGAFSSCIGAVLLFLLADIAQDRVWVLSAVSGMLLGGGNGLMVMAWGSVIEELSGKGLFACALAIVLGCCLLISVSQIIGARALLLLLTVGLTLVSALCYGIASSSREPLVIRTPTRGLAAAYARIGASFGCFGFLFAMMVMQFMIAPHGQASSFTWVFGFLGIGVAVVFLVVARAVQKSWDFLFAHRFVAIPTLVAVYPFDPGSDFSLKFALWFSTAAIWCFLTIAPGVMRSAARILKVPVCLTAGIGLGGLSLGAFAGYAVAQVIELLGPTEGYYINITAMFSMAIAVIGSNIVVTRGSLARAFRKASASPGEPDAADAAMRERVALAVKTHGLTNRESDVLAILARGHGLNRVQEDLYISEGTALTHKRHIYQKLDVHSKSELIDLVASIGVNDCEED